MKKLMIIFGSVIFASMHLTGCRGSGIENDSEILADYMCKFMKLSELKKAGDNSVEGK